MIWTPPTGARRRRATPAEQARTSLTFTHTVVQPNYSTQGIAVLADSLAAERRHDKVVGIAGGRRAVAHSAESQRQPPRWTGRGRRPAPTVTGVRVSSSPASGDTYLLGETIQVTLTFSENVTVTGSPRLKIDMDPAGLGREVGELRERQRHGKPDLLPHGDGAETTPRRA